MLASVYMPASKPRREHLSEVLAIWREPGVDESEVEERLRKLRPGARNFVAPLVLVGVFAAQAELLAGSGARR